MRVRLEIQLPTSLVGYVRIELCGREIGMAEHFLDRPQVCSSLEQVRGKRVPEEVRMHAVRVQARFLSQFPEDQEGAGAGQRPASGVQKELRAVPRIEVRAAAGEVTQKCLGGVSADRHDALLAAFPDHPNEPVVEVDAGFVEPDRLGDAEPRAVEQLDERLVAQRAWLRSGCGLDEPFGLAG
jgi:hypothetical protein